MVTTIRKLSYIRIIDIHSLIQIRLFLSISEWISSGIFVSWSAEPSVLVYVDMPT